MKVLLLCVSIAVVLCSTNTVFGDEKSEEEDAYVEVEQAEVNQVDEIVIEDKTPFVATSEWQPVRKGQAVPPGLHVRMNLQTGVTEAKLLDPEEGKADQGTDHTALSMTPDSAQDDSDLGKEEDADAKLKRESRKRMQKAMEEAMKEMEEENKKKPKLTVEELREKLRNYKAERDNVQVPHVLDGREKFRSMDEIKKDLADLEMNVKTDAEVLTKLLDQYQQPGLDEEQRVQLLTDLEYYLHQIDNAKDFADMGGLTLVIKDLNSTSEKVRSEAAFVIGSATQSNPKVQIVAIEAGALQQLIRMLPAENAVTVRSRILYALSAIVRHFPLAQEKFLSQGGLDALRHLFNEADVQKLQIKAVTLLTDMMVEMKEGLKSTEQEKKAQYERIPLIDAIHDQGWCDIIPSLLNLADHDYREKVLNFMYTVLDSCSTHFLDSVHMLRSLSGEYETLAEEEDPNDDLYFGPLLERVNVVLETVLKKEEL